jgi:chromosome segregation ATPase
MQAQSDCERAHLAQIARINSQHQEALDILREKLSAATSSSVSNLNRASDLTQALAKAEAEFEQEVARLKGRLAVCQVAELTVQRFIDSNGTDFSEIISRLISDNSSTDDEAKVEREQLAARAVAAVADITNQRDQLQIEADSLKEQLVAAEQKEANARHRFEDFISELQRQLASSMGREAAAEERLAQLCAELEHTTSSSVAAISASAQDISALRSRLSESETDCAALRQQLHACQSELSEVHSTLSHALESGSVFASARSLSSSVELELRVVRAALQESFCKEAFARSQVAECESKLANSQAIEAAARSRVTELEAAAKLWDVFVQEHTRKAHASVQLQSLLAAKSALADQQEKEVSVLRQHNADVSAHLADVEAKLADAHAVNAALQQQLAGTCFELEEVHCSLTLALQRESFAAREHVSNTEASAMQLRDLKSQLSDSKAVEKAARSCVLELEAALRLNKESLSVRCEELEQCRAKIVQLEQTAAEQLHELDTLKLQLADSEISKISTNDELVTARSEVEVLVKAKNHCSAEVDSLKLQLRDARAEISSLAEKLSSSAAEAESSRASLKDTSAREHHARCKELEASAKNQALLEKLRAAETRAREMEIQVESQTEFASASAKVSSAMRDACSHSEILMAQMKKNLASAAANEAQARKQVAQLEAQLSGYEAYFSQMQMHGAGAALFGIGLFIVSMNLAPAGLSTPRSSPLTPGNKATAR